MNTLHILSQLVFFFAFNSYELASRIFRGLVLVVIGLKGVRKHYSTIKLPIVLCAEMNKKMR